MVAAVWKRRRGSPAAFDKKGWKMNRATPRTRKDSRREKKKRVRAELDNKEELNMPATAMKKKGRVEVPVISPHNEEMVPSWMRYLMRSLREAEEKKIKRLEKRKRTK
jgi:hypothetical protein